MVHFEPWLETLYRVLRRDSALTVPLSTQVHKWVLVNLMLGVTLQWTSIPSSWSIVEIFSKLEASCYSNQDKLWLDAPGDSYEDITLHGLVRGRSRGRMQGVHPPPPEMTCGFLIQLVFCEKKIVSYAIP